MSPAQEGSPGRAGTPGRDPEYDRFGPWVLEITEDDPPPPLFVPHLRRAEKALMSVKVPRKIARRDAHPGMDLYDYVITLFERDMVIHERVEGDVRSRTISYDDVRQLGMREELLRGELHLGVAGAAYELPYNTVSVELMRHVAGLIRERYLEPTSERVDLPTQPELDQLSFYFERLLKDERQAGSAMRPLAAQPDMALGTLESGTVRRLLFGLVDKRLLESIHFCDGRELRVIDRGRPYAYRWQTTYGRRETIIPLANITEVRWDEGDTAVATLTVGTGGGSESWVFSPDNESVGAYVEWLARLV